MRKHALLQTHSSPQVRVAAGGSVRGADGRVRLLAGLRAAAALRPVPAVRQPPGGAGGGAARRLPPLRRAGGAAVRTAEARGGDDQRTLPR